MSAGSCSLGSFRWRNPVRRNGTMLALGCLHCEKYRDRCGSPPQQRLLWKRCTMNGEIPLVGAQALLSGAPRDGSNVWPLPFGPCSFAQINPGLAVADLKPIG